MALISILLSLVIEHYLGTLQEFRRYRWFEIFSDRVRAGLPERFADSGLAVFVVLALPALSVFALGAASAHTSLAVGFVFGLLVLLYSLGAQDLEAHIEAFIEARERGDDESARWHVAEIVGGELPDEPGVLSRAVIETALVELNERLLAIIFWFLLLGPVGALLYRLSVLLRSRVRDEESAFADWATRTHFALGFIPARLTALSYGLAGSLVDAIQYYREEAGKWRDANRGALIASGFGALQYGAVETESKAAEVDDLRAAVGLLRRTVVVWIVAIAVITLAGWNV